MPPVIAPGRVPAGGEFNVSTVVASLVRSSRRIIMLAKYIIDWGQIIRETVHESESRQPDRPRGGRFHRTRRCASLLRHVRRGEDRHAARDGEGIRMGQSALVASRHGQ